jgi:hypothetical protein
MLQCGLSHLKSHLRGRVIDESSIRAKGIVPSLTLVWIAIRLLVL